LSGKLVVIESPLAINPATIHWAYLQD